MKESDIRNSKTLQSYQNLVDKDVKKYFLNKNNFSQVNYKSWGCKKIKKIFRKKNFNYYQCIDTQTIFANPRPKTKILDHFYSSSKSSEFWFKKFFSPKLSVREKKIFRPRAVFFSKKFAKYKKKKILDIGAGMGSFLRQLKKKWPQAKLFAVEPSKSLASVCRSNDIFVYETTIEKLSPKINKFDAITSFELFEHLFDPKFFLQKIYNLLNKNGIFYFTTLNGMGFDIQTLGKNSNSIYPPYHLNFFNPKSIKKLLKKIGFKIVLIDTPGLLDWNIVENNLNKINNEKKMLFEYFSENSTINQKKKFQEYLQKNKLSSHMRIVAKK